jgi:hypothetical protein
MSGEQAAFVMGGPEAALMRARLQAQRLDVRGLAEQARPVLVQWRQALATERGDVPLELAAVLTWGAGGGSLQDPWPLPLATIHRLGGIPQSQANSPAPRIRLWAGLRTVNEAGAWLRENYPELAQAADDSHWAAASAAQAVGLGSFAGLVRAALQVAGPASRQPRILDAVTSFAGRASFAELAAATGPRCSPPATCYRVLTAAKRVEAARLLTGKTSQLASGGFGKLLEPPDARLRVKVARGVGGSYVAGLASFGAVQAVKWLWPRISG